MRCFSGMIFNMIKLYKIEIIIIHIILKFCLILMLHLNVIRNFNIVWFTVLCVDHNLVICVLRKFFSMRFCAAPFSRSCVYRCLGLLWWVQPYWHRSIVCRRPTNHNHSEGILFNKFRKPLLEFRFDTLINTYKSI